MLSGSSYLFGRTSFHVYHRYCLYCYVSSHKLADTAKQKRCPPSLCLSQQFDRLSINYVFISIFGPYRDLAGLASVSAPLFRRSRWLV